MILALDTELSEGTSIARWQELSGLIRTMIASLTSRSHSIYFSRPQVEMILAHCDLSRADERVIRGTYLSRFNDFHEWHRRALCRLTFSDNVDAPEISTWQGYQIIAPANDYEDWNLSRPISLIGEHLGNDVMWYIRIATVCNSVFGNSGLGVRSIPFHGGGGGVHVYFPLLKNNHESAFCLIDSDRDGCWDAIGKNPLRILQAAKQTGLISDHCRGYSTLRPMFGLKISSVRNVGNTVPPELVQRYYAFIEKTPAQLRAFGETFPNFPQLEDDEWQVWLGLNFENLPSSAAFSASFHGRISPEVEARVSACLAAGNPPRIPKSITGRILAWEQQSKDSSVLDDAVRRSLEVTPYRSAMFALLSDYASMASAFDRLVA